MFLPSRLSDSTVGDLLATVHRAGLTGVLELWARSGRYGVSLHRGLVFEVELPDAAPPIERPHADARTCRLEALFSLREADVRFRVARGRPAPVGVVPMAPWEVYHGRPRRRDGAPKVDPDPRERALATLGVGRDTPPEAVRAAFRRRVRELHPDLMTQGDEAERPRRERELRAVLEAWSVLGADRRRQ